MRLRVSIFSLAISLVLVSAAGAQQIRFPNFASVANLQRNGVAKQATWQGKAVLRLTDGVNANSGVARPEASSTYFARKQPISSGFTTYFSFQLHTPTSPTTGPGDGFSFLIQNAATTDPTMGASGSGLTAIGAGASASGAGGLGYAGISNSLAVEFDIRQDAWDPSANHAAVQSCGTNFNTPVHLPGSFTIGQNPHVTSCLVAPNAITSNIPLLAGTCAQGHCTDGVIHFSVIEYTPPNSTNPNGTLQVWVDPVFIPGTHTPKASSLPVINIPYTVTSLSLDQGSAWVGFTASQSTSATAQDILEWEFTPHTPTVIQQPIPNGGVPNPFLFGAHDMVVTYPVGTDGNGLFMTVVSTPIDRATFYRTRLQDTVFKNESCITYLETGGNCIVYSITCQLSDRVTDTPCPSESQDTIALSTSYYTADPVTIDNADFLKTDPIGSNNWISICNPPDTQPPCFDPNVFDGTTSGKGHDLSDLVATFQATQHSSMASDRKKNELMPAKPTTYWDIAF